MLEEARTRPGGWVYVIDPAFAPDGADGVVLPEGIVGAWKVAEDGVPTGEFEKNSRSVADNLALQLPGMRSFTWTSRSV